MVPGRWKTLPYQSGNSAREVISPLLAVLNLDGLETAVKAIIPYRTKANVIRYAEDFVIMGNSKELLEQTIKPAVEEFLMERGLTLSPEKTWIATVEDGFDFLGQNPRKYKGMLLIKPARKYVKGFLVKFKVTIRIFMAKKTGDMIRTLNPIIRGWANYHRHIVA
jgi:RNA-directed DNA polymerase